MARPGDITINHADVVSGNEIQSASWVARLDAIETAVNALNADILSQTDTSAQAIASNVVFAANKTLTMAAAIIMATKKITGLGDPTAAQDAATKTYVDGLIAVGLTTKAFGKVLSNGTKSYGSNFTSTRTAAGKYTLTFTTPFADTNYVLAGNQVGTTGTRIFVYTISSASGALVEMRSVAAGDAVDQAFSFIAVGAQ